LVGESGDGQTKRGQTGVVWLGGKKPKGKCLGKGKVLGSVIWSYFGVGVGGGGGVGG